jgi:hypothetical protein
VGPFRNQQVNGSSPFVGSIFFLIFPRKSFGVWLRVMCCVLRWCVEVMTGGLRSVKQATANANAGVLRCAQDDGERRARATATARATAMQVSPLRITKTEA